MKHSRRLARLIRECIEQLHLDLTGIVVLTEAATGHYAATAAIAAVAGAEEVFAVAASSSWGSAPAAGAATRTTAEALGVAPRLRVIESVTLEALGAADLVTNLGFVRPLDRERIRRLKPTAVVSLMCEPWELRPADVDIEACMEHGIAVLGTNEHTPEWPVFSYNGPLAIQMLLDAGFEVLGTRVAVLGRDSFAPAIGRALRAAGARVHIDRLLTRKSARTAARGADAIIVADYASAEIIVGSSGLVTTGDLLDVAPDAVIIQFAGGVDDVDLRANDFVVWPDKVMPPRRMSRTFAALGPKPVVELHAAGLLVGEAAVRLRRAGVPAPEVIDRVCRELPLALPPTAGHATVLR